MKPLTPQQEKFARLVAEGNNQSDACQLAGIDLCDKPAKDGYDEHIGELERIIKLQVGNFRSRGLTC